MMGEEAFPINSDGDTASVYAAKACLEYSLNNYNDWFLPSRDELNLMYVNLKDGGVGSLGNGYYWSSSEAGDSHAWCQHFAYAYQSSYDRGYQYVRVRAVRGF